MKRAFTLIEIVITLMLIGLVLAMVSRMGQGFSDRIRFANTKEEVNAMVTNVIHDAATTNMITVDGKPQRYGFINLKILSGTALEWTYASGQLETPIVHQKTLSHGLIMGTGFSLILAPYKVGCESDGLSIFQVHSTDNGTLKACYETDLATCKIREVKCP